MEIHDLTKDIELICTKAKSFPDGIKEAFLKLENTIPESRDRVFYGLSKLEFDGQIVYKAAVLEGSKGEAENYQFESFTIPKGRYPTITITDWKEHPKAIEWAFMALLADPRLYPITYCVEEYRKSGEVVCMVRILTI